MATSAALSDPALLRRARMRALAVGSGAKISATILLADTIAAIGFAAGVAGSVVHVLDGIGAVLPWALLMLVSGCLRGVFTMIAADVGGRSARAAKHRLRRRIVAAVLARPAGGDVTTGGYLNAAVDEVEALDGYVARFLPARMAAALAPLVVLTAIAIASPIAAAILAFTLIPFIVAMALAGGAAAEESRRQFAALAQLSSLFADRVAALPIILAFRAESRETDRLAVASTEVADRTMRVLRVAFLSSGALEFFAALSVALVAVYAGFNLLGLLPFPVPEHLDLGRAFFALALAPEFYAPMRRLAAAYHDRQAAETAMERLDALPAPAALDVPDAPAIPCPPAIAFRAVTIRYPETDRDAIRGFSLSVEPGEAVALVGASGSGKTSLLHLLLGLAPLTSGQVLIGDRDLAGIGSIAAMVAWVGQFPLILPRSIRSNIALAHPDASAAEIDEVVARSGLGAMLARRSEGLDTVLDPRGSGLSGGERHRIGLARALLKPAPVLLLDEPTAHLDPAAEAELIDVLRSACRGRTVLIATHSHPLAAIADRRIALDIDR